MTPHVSLGLTLSVAIDKSNAVGREMQACETAYIQRAPLAAMKVGIEQAAREAEQLASLLRAEAGRLTEHLNRHAVIGA